MSIRAIRYVSALLCALGATVVLGRAGQGAFAQQLEYQQLGDGMNLFQIRPNFYVLTGAGANVGIQFGKDGAIVVDAGDAEHADRVAAQLAKFAPASQPIRYVINTSADPDHVGGNEKVAKVGKSLLAGMDPAAFLTGVPTPTPAAILSTEGVLFRMSGVTGPAVPSALWPTESFPQPRKYMFINGEGIEVMYQPAAHTDGDSIVFFRRSDVVMAGDIIDMRRFPVIDTARGGGIAGEIAALNRLVELAIPSVPLVWREEGTVVVPGHGHLLDQTDVVDYRDMVTIIRDRIDNLMKQGKSLAEIKAAKPTQGYTARYGTDTGPWTTDMFVEAIHKSLAAGAPKSR